MTAPEIETQQSGGPAPRYRILIAGSMGFGNAGDEAILASMVEGFRGLPAAVEITVVSGNPAGTARLHGVSTVPWQDPQAIAAAVNANDLTILGGGGRFHDYRGFDPDLLLTQKHWGLSYSAAIAALSVLHRKPLMVYAVGVGHLLSEHGRLFTKAICDAAACISVRDQGSREQLRSLGVSESRISVTADPAFALCNSALAPPTEASPQPHLVGVALRAWNLGVDEAFWERQVAAALDLLLDAEKGRAVFVPFQSESGAEDDTAAMHRVIGQMRHAGRADLSTPAQSIGETASILRQCRVVLGMRLHSVVFSTLTGVPFVALACDPEVSLLAGELGMREFTMPLGGIDGVRLAELLRQSLARHDEISERLKLAAGGMRSRAHENLRLAAALLETKPPIPEITPAQMEVLARAVDAQMRFATVVTAERDALAACVTERGRELETSRAAHVAEVAAYQAEVEALHTKTDEERAAGAAEIKVLRTRADALRQRSAQDADRLAHAQLRVRQLSRELDLARNELRTANRPPSTSSEHIRWLEARLAPLEAKSAGAVLKRALLVLLDLLEIVTPEFLRRFIRRYYLEYFYFRIYPERRPSSPVPGPAVRVTANVTSDVVAYSEYAPFIEFKYRLCRDLPMDFQPVSSHRRDGLISVVLPVYNGERYIRESVESVLAQSYRDLELIVVDDGSTDGTPRILESYAADPRVRIIHQSNQKLPAALTNGFAAARGEFYTWTSDDNIMTPDQLAELAAFLRDRPEVELVYADEYIIDEEGRPAENSDFCPGYQTPPGSNVICRPQDTGELNFVPNNYIGGCFLYRAWAGKILGDYDRGCFGFEDYDYWMRMNALFRISHVGIRKPLYHYRLHSSSLTAYDRPLRITERMREFMAVEESRRSFFAESFDITLVGRHPWFEELRKHYQEYGNNVFSIEELTETIRYHYEVTRAFPKSAIVFSATIPAPELERFLEWSQAARRAVRVLLTDGARPLALPDSILDAFDWIVATGDGAWQQAGEGHDRKMLLARSAEGLAYPLLAAVNTHCYAQHRAYGNGTVYQS